MNNVIQFPKPRQLLPRLPRQTICELLVYAARGDVHMLTDDVELTLTPAQARAFAQDLLELADEAEPRAK